MSSGSKQLPGWIIALIVLIVIACGTGMMWYANAHAQPAPVYPNPSPPDMWPTTAP